MLSQTLSLPRFPLIFSSSIFSQTYPFACSCLRASSCFLFFALFAYFSTRNSAFLLFFLSCSRFLCFFKQLLYVLTSGFCLFEFVVFIGFLSLEQAAENLNIFSSVFLSKAMLFSISFILPFNLLTIHMQPEIFEFNKVQRTRLIRIVGLNIFCKSSLSSLPKSMH